MCQYCFNRYRQINPDWDESSRRVFRAGDVLELHRSLPEYAPTPLISLPSLADRLGIGCLLVKDESHRFGLKAFKALGASYAVYRFVRAFRGKELPAATLFYSGGDTLSENELTFCTATDGNHGRGVAWIARKLKQRAVIYMPAGSVPDRVESIRAEGARVVIADGDYDRAVALAAAEAGKNGWQIISDTSWPGYEKIPRWIMAGYTTLFREIDDIASLCSDIDVVFVPGGVGALAAAASWYYNSFGRSHRVKLVSVEPTEAACLLESARSVDGQPHVFHGRLDSIMAGLNCGTPSPVAWPLIRAGFDFFVSISDDFCRQAIRAYYYPGGDDPRIVSGESGAAGLGALLALCELPRLREAREQLGLGRDSTVLLLNTEGDTDPTSFKNIIKLRT